MQLEIEKIIPGALGLARKGTKRVLVENALPGELVEVEITREKKDLDFARATHIVRASPARVEAKCPLYERCGGCDFQHVADGAQAAFKQDILRDALLRQTMPQLRTSDSVTFEAIDKAIIGVKGPSWEYRNRVQFHPVGKGGPGFLERASHRPLAVPDCPILAPVIRDWLASDPQIPAESSRYPVWGEGKSLHVGPGKVGVNVAGLALQFDAGSFFQSNLSMLELLSQRIRAGLADIEGSVLDLYGGVGLFGLLSPQNVETSMVEIDPDSCASARANAQRNGRSIRVIEGDLEREAVHQAVFDRPYSAIVIDPPRSGLNKRLLEAVLAARARRLLWVSCDPVSFARDLGSALLAGYRLSELLVYDWYPQTSHIETMAVLELPLE